MEPSDVRDIEAKTGIGKAAFPDSFFVSLYRALAPYRGCGHGCRYCDGRAEKYYVEGDFERDIAVRANLAGLVARDVANGAFAREWGAVGLGSGVTDVYQPLERERMLTRKTLEALIPSGADKAEVPIVILTKNSLILRDFDLIARFPRALVIVTVTTTDPEAAAILEPGASPPAERLEVVRRAKEAGFYSGVMAMPLCPGISAEDDSVRALFDAAACAGADFVYPGGLTLRPGKQKDLFVSTVGAHWPRLLPLYERVYRENRQSGIPLAAYAGPLIQRWDRELAARGMPQLIPHRIHRDVLSPADSLFALFCHMGQLYDARGVDTRPLKAAVDRYAKWLADERTRLRRKRSSDGSEKFPVTAELARRLEALCLADRGIAPGRAESSATALPFGLEPETTSDRGERGLADVLGNAKLADLAARVVLDGQSFNYSTLALTPE